MDKKKGILLTVFLIFLVTPLSSAFNASSDIYSIGSYNMGTAGNTPEGTDFSSRDTLTYQQAGNDNASSSIYSLNLGWFKRIVTPSEEEVVEEEVSAGGGGGETSILFDVDILEFESPVKLGDFFDFTYSIKGMGNINNDVTIDFWIEKEGEIMSSGSSVVFMGNNEEKTGTASLFLPSDIDSGIYNFVLQATFQASKGEARRTIEITVRDEEAIIEKLFDIKFSLDDLLIQSSDELSAFVTFESFGTEPTPVDLTFIILDAEGKEVYREESDIIVTTEEVLRWNYEGLEGLPDGKYTAILETLYNVDVYDEFRQDFEIGKEKRGITGKTIDWIGGKGKWWLGGLIGLVAIGGLGYWLIKKQKSRKEKKQRKKVKIYKKSLFTRKGIIIKIINKKSRQKSMSFKEKVSKILGDQKKIVKKPRKKPSSFEGKVSKILHKPRVK